MDTAQVQRHLEELAEPLRHDLAAVEGAITRAEETLADLRATRHKLLAVLGKILPAEYGTAKPKDEPKPKGKQIATPEEVEATRMWLLANLPNGDGIWTNRLQDDQDFRAQTGVRSGVISQILAELHEQSFLTLDRVMQGGGKAYKVVS